MALTDRILVRLPGPRSLWILVWVALGFCRPMFLAAALDLTGVEAGWGFVAERLRSTSLVAYLMLASFWLVGRSARDLAAAEPALFRLTREGGAHAAEHLLQGISSTRGPLLLTALLTLILEVNVAVRYGVFVAAVMLPVVAVANVPLMTGLWVYSALLVGLDRLGRGRLALDPFPEDRGLGLRPIGTIAFSAFWRLSVAVVPFLLFGTLEPLDLVLGLVPVAAGVFLLFLSLNRLHRQMVAAKREYVAWARGFYARAVEPLKAAPTLEVLQRQAPLMSAAEALERRAESILEWPFDERTMTRIVGIVTAVFTAFVTRLVLNMVGL